jgi:tripartite-type tricarboxylate transporter receptor subunit TctC
MGEKTDYRSEGNMVSRRAVLKGAGVLGATLATSQWQAAGAETYPSRPIRLYVAQAPAGTGDITARTVGEYVGQRLGQSVVVENKTGAGGIIATEAAAQAAPDGYTLYLSSVAPLAIIPAIKRVTYDPLKDFEHITISAVLPLVLAVHPDVPANNVAEFIAYAKAHPKDLNFASSGVGTVTQLSGELMKVMAGINMVHVPFRGSAQSTTALLAGQVQVAFADSSILQYAEAGKVKALAVTTAQRTAIAPNIPTMAESGLPGYASYAWLGFSAPAKTPKTIIDKLYSDLNAVMQLKELRDKLIARGIDPMSLTPEETTKYVAAEVDKWKRLIKDANLKFD